MLNSPTHFFQFIYYKFFYFSVHFNFCVCVFQVHSFVIFHIYFVLACFRAHAMFLIALNQNFIWHYLTMKMLSLLFSPFSKKKKKKNCMKQLNSSYGVACLNRYVCHVSTRAKWFHSREREKSDGTRRIRDNQTMEKLQTK